MKNKISEKIKLLASKLSYPLYLVGGSPRNYLISGEKGTDYDLSSAVTSDELEKTAKELGFKIVAVYKRTNTVLFKEGETQFEFASFRREKYFGGEHTPYAVEHTLDIREDALRRDFKCNAVYYDIAGDKFVDPLGGIEDIKNKRLDTVTDAKEVFSHDGLRLMRLARFAGELGFTPTEETLKGATLYAENITQIVPERIYEELKKILVSDTKNSFSDKQGHYTGLKILQKTGVLGYILPELTLGENMPQRKDFHAYDVLEHTLKTVLYADKSIRLPALFHDIGKPYAYKTHGKFASHSLDGEIIARETLNRLKAPVKIIEEVCLLTALHMVDFDLKMKRNKVKLFIARYHGIFDKLLLLKQADFSACKGDLSTAPTVIKWKEIYSEMIATNTPFTLKDLHINGDDLKEAGFIGEKIKIVLEEILTECIIFPERNEREWLLNSLKRRKND